MTLDRPGNLLGALALGVADRTSDAVVEAADRSSSAAVVLSALLNFLDRPSVDLLRRVLGLTSSGTVRVLDRLESEGLVRREPGADARSTAVVLTARGRRAAERVAAARAAVLQTVMAPLSAAERRTLEVLAGKMLVGLIRPPGAVRWGCRLCDMKACGRTEGSCPVFNAAVERYGPADEPENGG